MHSIPDALLDESRKLARRCDAMHFGGKVHTTYNAFGYAFPGYEAYIRKFANDRKRAVFLGMNPGPWGMAQTGVPFGEIAAVRGWMGLSADISKPKNEHPKRPVEGFDCQRSEVSGRRLWGLFSELFPTAQSFFKDFMVFNYCPLVFMLESGANLTPDKLAAIDRQHLEEACDAHLRSVIEILEPEIAVGVGGFATKCLQRLDFGGLRIGTILHPSPASPVANREWPQRPVAQLRDLKLIS